MGGWVPPPCQHIGMVVLLCIDVRHHIASIDNRRPYIRTIFMYVCHPMSTLGIELQRRSASHRRPDDLQFNYSRLLDRRGDPRTRVAFISATFNFCSVVLAYIAGPLWAIVGFIKSSGVDRPGLLYRV
jgi:hypothetical protein